MLSRRLIWSLTALNCSADVITPMVCTDASPVHPVLKNLLLGTLNRLWNIACPMHRCLSRIHRFNWCLTDLHQKPGHRIIRQPSDAPMPIASVLPVLLKYLCLNFFDLDFFTVSSILVLWTEERNHRRGGPSGLATHIFSLSSLEPKILRMVILIIILVTLIVLSFDHQNHSK